MNAHYGIGLIFKRMTPEEQRQAINRIAHRLRGEKPKILLVEDNANDIELFERTLKSHDLKATAADSVKEALELIDHHRFQIIFLDLKLKPTDCWEDVLRYAKDKNPDTQVIVLTGVFACDDAECKKALRMGASAVILKPLTHEQVRLIFGTL